MLCPEVWNFTPPAHYFNFKKGNFNEEKEETKCTDLIDSHFFNHLVSIVLPDTINVPDIIKESLNEDCDYYKVEQLSVNELINKEFIEAFVKKGNVTVLSYDTHIDTDDCAALTPSGHLILSLNKETYQQLGLEGKPSFFCRADAERYGDAITPVWQAPCWEIRTSELQYTGMWSLPDGSYHISHSQ